MLQLAHEAHHRAGHKIDINHAKDAPLIETYDDYEEFAAQNAEIVVVGAEDRPALKKYWTSRGLPFIINITDHLYLYSSKCRSFMRSGYLKLLKKEEAK